MVEASLSWTSFAHGFRVAGEHADWRINTSFQTSVLVAAYDVYEVLNSDVVRILMRPKSKLIPVNLPEYMGDRQERPTPTC